jgi:peptide chain release factor 3
MNPLHRDSVAFLRVSRGGFEREAAVTHGPTGRRLRLGHASALFASERETMDAGCAGDIVGLPNPGFLAIGDSLYAGAPPEPVAMPRFQPEHFAVLRGTDVSKHKAFRKGIDQLQLEGATQILHSLAGGRRDPILAAVGRLQFDVVQFRLRAEYGVRTQLEPLPYAVARWLEGPADEVARFQGWGTMRCEDHLGRPVVLFGSERDLDFFARENPRLQFRAMGETPAADPSQVRA